VHNNGESDNQRTTRSSRKTHLGCRIILLSPNDAVSQYWIAERYYPSDPNDTVNNYCYPIIVVA
jgi:hypothetical protein